MRSLLDRVISLFSHQVHNQLPEIPWTAACQASLSFTISWSYSNSCLLSWWCYPTIFSSVTPFSSCPLSFPALEFFCHESICHEAIGLNAMILVFWRLSFKPALLLPSFTLIKRVFTSSLLSVTRVVSFAYLRLLIFLLAISVPACDSFSLHSAWC